MKEQSKEDRRNDLLLWLVVLGSPTIWLIHFQLNYALVPVACAYELPWLLRLIACSFLLPPIILSLLAWRLWSHPMPSGPIVESRSRFMALLGLLICAIIFLVTVGQAIATFIIDPCSY